MKIILGLFLTFALSFFISCDNKQDNYFTDALNALKKIDAAHQVGCNYTTFGQLVIDAQAKTNLANEKLPNGELKTELNQTMKSYADCYKYWGKLIDADISASDGLDTFFIEAKTHLERTSALSQ